MIPRVVGRRKVPPPPAERPTHSTPPPGFSNLCTIPGPGHLQATAGHTCPARSAPTWARRASPGGGGRRRPPGAGRPAVGGGRGRAVTPGARPPPAPTPPSPSAAGLCWPAPGRWASTGWLVVQRGEPLVLTLVFGPMARGAAKSRGVTFRSPSHQVGWSQVTSHVYRPGSQWRNTPRFLTVFKMNLASNACTYARSHMHTCEGRLLSPRSGYARDSFLDSRFRVI